MPAPGSSGLSVAKLEGVRGVTIYKVVAGASTLSSYNDGGGAAASDDLDGDGSLQHREWRALYTQFQREHVLGTVPYRWEKEHVEATLVAVTFELLLTFDAAHTTITYSPHHYYIQPTPLLHTAHTTITGDV